MNKFLSFSLAVSMSAIAFAQSATQTINVQGVQREVPATTISRSATDGTCDVDFAKIERWIGEGTNQAALAIKFNDEKAPKILVWGYRWAEGTTATGETMLRDVAKGDPGFYALVYGDTQYGAAIGGMGYDLDGDGFSLLLDGAEQTATDNIYYTSEYNFDDYISGDADDVWFSGWYNGYFSYWVADKSGDTYGYSGVGATGRELTNGCIDGWAACRDMSDWNSANMIGELEYLPALKDNNSVDYSNGVFIVNEDWYGHQNSTVNFLTAEGEWIYRVVQKENPGVELGATACFGTIYGDKFYIMSKQDKDPGASIAGARLTILDAKTMKVLKQHPIIVADADGKSLADGRGFLGVDENKGYIGTSNGIYPIDFNTFEIGQAIAGADNGEDNGSYGSLYSGQIGNMVRVNDRVFAVHQKNGLLVINPYTDQVEQTFCPEEIGSWRFGSVVLAKDGNLWLSLANVSGSGAADNRIMKLDPATLEYSLISLPEGVYGPANSWYAWTPDCFCASTQENALYWNGGASSWFCGETIFKYDIDNDKFSTLIDLAAEGKGWQIYGCSFRIDPVSNEAIVSIFKGYGDTTYVLRKYDQQGTIIAEYPMISNYWFPGVPVFPDNEAPIVETLDAVSFDNGNEQSISLKDVATDADNMQAAIIKTIKEISNESILSAQIVNGDLVITPIAVGDADITIQINSNGKLAETIVSVSISDLSGIDGVNSENNSVEVARYTLDGKLLNAPQRGVNIIRMSDGTIKKVIVK